jgi:hypothetical protein
MLKLLAKLFGAKTKETAPAEAPYKVETTEAPKCGCGRSPTGSCVGLHKLSDAEWTVHADNPAKVSPVAEVATTAMVKSVAKPKKKPVVNKPAAKKVDKTASVKAPRKPRQPKKA